MAKEKKYHTEINCETGEEITREFTAEEYEAHALMVADMAEKQAADEAEAEAKAEAKASAVAKLSAIGLTEEEIKAIAGN